MIRIVGPTAVGAYLYGLRAVASLSPMRLAAALRARGVIVQTADVTAWEVGTRELAFYERAALISLLGASPRTVEALEHADWKVARQIAQVLDAGDFEEAQRLTRQQFTLGLGAAILS